MELVIARPGETIFDIELKAAKRALISQRSISYLHNDRTYVLSLEEAKEVCSLERCQERVACLRRELVSLQRLITGREKLIAEEADFIKRIYGVEL